MSKTLRWYYCPKCGTEDFDAGPTGARCGVCDWRHPGPIYVEDHIKTYVELIASMCTDMLMCDDLKRLRVFKSNLRLAADKLEKEQRGEIDE